MIRTQWKGLAYGIVIGIAGNWVFLWQTNHLDNAAYKAEAFKELTQRLISTHQATVMISTISPTQAFQGIREMYEDTKSETGNPKFEGKRLENIIFDLQRLSGDETMNKLLDRVKYLRSDIPFSLKDENLDAYHDDARQITFKLQDYYCCLSLASGQADAIMCSPPDRYFTSSHHCIYDNELFVPPERMTIQRGYPIDPRLLK